MIHRGIVIGILGLISAELGAGAQSLPVIDSRAGLPAGVSPLDHDASAPIPSAIAPKKPRVQETKPRYPSNPANYPSSLANLRTPKIDPNSAAAQRQSGLSAADATSLITSRGYTHIDDVRAMPNSIWVWQADALKNGRRVRLGIDYRGNLLELSNSPPQPCARPGIGFGASPMGVGVRLSEAMSCAAQ